MHHLGHTRLVTAIKTTAKPSSSSKTQNLIELEENGEQAIQTEQESKTRL